MSSLPQSGIYRIVCTVDGRFYIGSSLNLEARWDKHKRQLRAGNHHNIYLQRAWDKYGEHAFIFEIMEHVAPWVLVLREQYWLDKLKPFGKRGFNCSKIAGAPMTGRKHSPETLAKMSMSLKGRIPHNKGIPSPLKGIRHTPEQIEKMAITKRGKPLSAKAQAAASVANAREYIVTDPSGVESVVRDLGKFCREHDLNASGMYHVVGKNKTYKKWKCKRA